MSEPVRAYGYSVVVALVGLLVYLGVVDASLAAILVTAAAAVLSVPAVEAVRASVTPNKKLPNTK